MKQKKILLDTNSYLRLAKSIFPLLATPFGASKYTLYIHKELNNELKRSSRLQNKFSWINDKDYLKNRKALAIPKHLQKDIELAYDHIWNYQNEEGKSLSREDIYCIATALICQIPLITDDQGMLEVAKEFRVKSFPTLYLMKLMLENKYIELKKIEEIIEYWKYLNDIPANFKRDFIHFFKTNPP